MLEVGSGSDIKPTYAEHSMRPLTEIEEIASALKVPYPHFLSVLTPERNLLHYIISGLVCNASLENKEELFAHTARLYDANVEALRDIHRGSKDEIDSEREAVGDHASRYFEYRRHTQSHVQGEMPAEWEVFFEDKFNQLMKSNYEGYLPGMIHGSLDTLPEVFRVLSQNDYERSENERIAWEVAQAAIKRDIQDGRLKPLPEYSSQDRMNLVMAGVIGSGKNHFLMKMEKEGKIHRRDYAFIDLDDYKWFDRIVQRDHDAPEPTWNKRAHDECHMIRRKIFDELEAKAQLGQSPNTLLLTSHLSQRALQWLTHDHPRVNVYLFACEPDRALLNTAERHQSNHEGKPGRRMSTKAVLESERNIAVSVGYLMFQTTGGNRLYIQLEDTSHARDVGGKSSTVLKTHASNAVHVYDVQGLVDTLKGYYIDMDATSPQTAFVNVNQEELMQRASAVLKPHEVMFYNPGQSNPIATKSKDSGAITPIGKIEEATLLLLKAIDPSLEQRMKTGTQK